MKGFEHGRTAGLVGSMAGLALFLFIGLSHGALIGGTAGMQAGKLLFGGGMHVLLRAFGAAGMLVGIALAGTVFVTLGFITGRFVGLVLGANAVEAKGVIRVKGN